MATATVSVTVLDPDLTATDDFVETLANTPIIIDVLDNDFDVLGRPLIITSVTQPTDGLVEIATDQKSVTFTPETNFIGVMTFDYEVGLDTSVVGEPFSDGTFWDDGYGWV